MENPLAYFLAFVSSFLSLSLSLSLVSLCAAAAAAAAAKDFASTAHRIHEDFSESLAGFGCHRVRAALLRLLIPQLPGTDIHSWAFFLFFVLVVISSLFLPSSSSSFSSSLQRILFPPGFCNEVVITSFFTMLGDDYCALTVSLCCFFPLAVFLSAAFCFMCFFGRNL
jgi:hypothetical protein